MVVNAARAAGANPGEIERVRDEARGSSVIDVQAPVAAAQQPQPQLHIRAHGQARYEAAVTVLTSAQRLGLTQLGMVGNEQFAN